MYEVKCLKDFGTWCKKGTIRKLNNEFSVRHDKLGNVKIIRFLGNQNDLTTKDNIKHKINMLDIKIKVLETEKNEYIKILKGENK